MFGTAGGFYIVMYTENAGRGEKWSGSSDEMGLGFHGQMEDPFTL